MNTKSHTNPLFDAALRGDFLAINYLLEGVIVDSETGDVSYSAQGPVDCNHIDPVTGKNAMHFLVEAPADTLEQKVSKYDAAILLLRKGINLNVLDQNGHTGLSLAKASEYHIRNPRDRIMTNAIERHAKEGNFTRVPPCGPTNHGTRNGNLPRLNPQSLTARGGLVLQSPKAQP